MEEAVTKEVFKKLYFKHADANSGWTAEYWNKFFEREEGKRYFFSKPHIPSATRMFIVTDAVERRMVFLSEDAEETLFDFPANE